MLSEREKIETLTRLGIDLNLIQDLDMLMERILTEVRRFVNADAGSIYIREGDKLNFTYTQNDTLQQRLNPGEKLIYSTFSIPVDEKSIAGYVALTGQPLNLKDVYHISPEKPYGFSSRFDNASQYRTGSMLTIPLKNVNGHVIGILQAINSQDESKNVVPFPHEDEKMVMLFASIAVVALERAQMTRAIILRMIKMAEMRDPKETGAHVNRVGGYAIELYEKWAYKYNFPKHLIDKNRDILRMAAMLHDVGKVGISDVILKKPGRFTNEEYEIMKKHSIMGAQLFQDRQSSLDEISGIIALNHHERWDGKGYPGHVDTVTGSPLPGYEKPDGNAIGKKGEEIPIFGRIVALADVFDALSSVRVYKEAWDEARVLSTIEEEAGHQFDPELVEIFFSSLDIIRSIQDRYSEKA
ncbi:Putative phosphohydrolase, GAF and HD domains-containing [Desulfonema limicola]|uniref:Phosphohydrolase, GAF and HD domains-containing n=1 Tax=Desulfonema limicola TaxID=45656 RepID=A0A975B3G1_9BACT|nr:HD domain-containing phosphohydrolase [Desulfonema limicola]QTA78095.1 Putative phosphohydrolase, GAF and HD domains-containing [Desulfonema limicola]